MALGLRPQFSDWDEGSEQGSERDKSSLRKILRFLLIAGAHVAVLAGATLFVRPELATDVERVYVRLVEDTPVPVVENHPPSPPPVRPKSVPRPPPVMPVMAAVPDATTTTAFTIVPAPSPIPEPAPAPAAAAPAVVTEASFDAEYLHNPKPVYPWAARRRGDEGRVTLRVRVSAQGAALAVEIAGSSGSSLLDEAALDAVRRWRFVPARRGNEAIESWVSVPIVFRIDG